MGIQVFKSVDELPQDSSEEFVWSHRRFLERDILRYRIFQYQGNWVFLFVEKSGEVTFTINGECGDAEIPSQKGMVILKILKRVFFDLKHEIDTTFNLKKFRSYSCYPFDEDQQSEIRIKMFRKIGFSGPYIKGQMLL